MPSIIDPPSGGKAPIRLRLVHPAPPKPPRQRHRRGSTFTREEEARLKAALRNARGRFGSWGALATAMRFCPAALARAAMARKVVSAEIAVRLARALVVPVESLYAAPADASRCPTCGRSGAT